MRSSVALLLIVVGAALAETVAQNETIVIDDSHGKLAFRFKKLYLGAAVFRREAAVTEGVDVESQEEDSFARFRRSPGQPNYVAKGKPKRSPFKGGRGKRGAYGGSSGGYGGRGSGFGGGSGYGGYRG